MLRSGRAAIFALALAACTTEPGDDSSGSETAASTTDPGTGTTDSGATAETTTTSGEPETTTGEPPTTGEPTTEATATTDDATTGAVDPQCAEYCADNMTHCTGPQAQYPSLDSCLRACASFPAGARGDVSGNSLACRLYHTDAAADDAETHCVHAGPAGGGACGDNCDGFCAIAVGVCPTEHPSPDACLGACMGFVDDEKFDIGDAAGDTLACRLYHLTVAATSDADAAVHCPHTLQDSPPCM